MQRWVEDRYGEEDDFDFYAVNINEDRDHVAEYVEQIGLEVPVILGTSQLFNQYRLRGGVSPYPVDYLIDGERIVRYANHEYTPEIILMTIDRLLEMGEDELPVIDVHPDSLDFGEIEIDSGAHQPVAIYNIGEAELIVSEVVVEGAGFNVDFEGEAVLEPNDSLEVAVTFTPVEIAVYEGTMTITSNDSDNSDAIVYLRGVGKILGTKEDDAYNLFPGEYYLEEPRPNPFNATTELSYGLPGASHVSIHVYDLWGRLMATLVDANQPAGRYVTAWNAQTSSTGIYIVRFEAGDVSISSKAVLIK